MYIVDRFEGIYAICEDEDRRMHNIKKSELPQKVKEGDCIEYIHGTYIINDDMTNKIKKENTTMLDDMWK